MNLYAVGEPGHRCWPSSITGVAVRIPGRRINLDLPPHFWWWMSRLLQKTDIYTRIQEILPRLRTPADVPRHYPDDTGHYYSFTISGSVRKYHSKRPPAFTPPNGGSPIQGKGSICIPVHRGTQEISMSVATVDPL
jgi:hypothetical protein